MANKQCRAKLRFTVGSERLQELSTLLPDAVLTVGQRRVLLRWRGSKGLRTFLAEILEDEDLLPMVRAWHPSWTFEPEIMIGFNLLPTEVDELLRQLRRLRQ